MRVTSSVVWALMPALGFALACTSTSTNPGGTGGAPSGGGAAGAPSGGSGGAAGSGGGSSGGAGGVASSDGGGSGGAMAGGGGMAGSGVDGGGAVSGTGGNECSGAFESAPCQAGAGKCRSGMCCTGCWNGSGCVTVVSKFQCGEKGDDCQTCPEGSCQPDNNCSGQQRWVESVCVSGFCGVDNGTCCLNGCDKSAGCT